MNKSSTRCAREVSAIVWTTLGIFMVVGCISIVAYAFVAYKNDLETETQIRVRVEKNAQDVIAKQVAPYRILITNDRASATLKTLAQVAGAVIATPEHITLKYIDAAGDSVASVVWNFRHEVPPPRQFSASTAVFAGQADPDAAQFDAFFHDLYAQITRKAAARGKYSEVIDVRDLYGVPHAGADCRVWGALERIEKFQKQRNSAQLLKRYEQRLEALLTAPVTYSTATTETNVIASSAPHNGRELNALLKSYRQVAEQRRQAASQTDLVFLTIQKSVAYYVLFVLMAVVLWLWRVFPRLTRLLWPHDVSLQVRDPLDRASWLPALGYGLAIWFILRAAFWWRNPIAFLVWPSAECGRVIFAISNWDLCIECFFVQEGLYGLTSILLGLLWRQWIKHFQECDSEAERVLHNMRTDSFFSYAASAFDTRARAGDLRKAAMVRNVTNLYKKAEKARSLVRIAFAQWQITSVLLAVGFGAFSSFFWILVGGYKDMRYVYDGVALHFIWSVTWIILSLPLITLWVRWHEILSEFRIGVAENVASDSGLGDDGTLNQLLESSPVAVWNLVTSSIVAVVTFISPVFHFLSRT